MKKSVVALAVMALGVTSVHAAEIYNKDGNKLDLYGKVKAAHSWTDGTNADETYARLATASPWVMTTLRILAYLQLRPIPTVL